MAVLGVALVLWCVRDFYSTGKGTLAPWKPPKRLVVVGLYRYVRNPMYLGLLTLIFGMAWWLTSIYVAEYGLVVAVAVHLRVVSFEEPRLARTFGDEWKAYTKEARRWVPALRPFGRTPVDERK